jgi:glycosyltransferase involved in cell wall biosynthesis
MKPVIATFLSHYAPGYKAGGPLQSIVNLVERLGDEFDFRIITSDRDLGDECPYAGVPVGRWGPAGKAEVIYLPPRPSFGAIRDILNATRHDLLYLNSFFDPQFTMLPLVARRLGRLDTGSSVLLAPRGEFSDGALRLKSAKKRAFMWASRVVGLHRGLIWQASTVHEASDIRRAMGEVDIICAPDLPRRIGAAPQRTPRATGDPLRIAFLSRISPMKNLHFALEVLTRVRAPVIFTIHGPREDAEYWERCAAVIAAMPSHVRVIEVGPVDHREVVATLARHDLFFLPSRGENYGHVIAEALEAGLRLLISDRTPWRGLAEAGVGYDLPLDDPDAFARAVEMESATARDDGDMLKLRHYLEHALDVEQAIDANRQLLRRSLAGASSQR